MSGPSDGRYRAMHYVEAAAADLTQAANTVVLNWNCPYQRARIPVFGLTARTAISAPSTPAAIRLEKIATGTTTPVVDSNVNLAVPGAMAANTVAKTVVNRNTNINAKPDYFEVVRGDLVRLAIETQGVGTQSPIPWMLVQELPGDAQEGPV